MKAIQRNLPSIIGWIAYYAYETALSIVLVWAIYLLLFRFFNIPLRPFFSILLLVIYALSGFLSFIASAKWIVLPLIQRTRTINEVPSLKSLFFEWVLLCIGVFLFRLFPLLLLKIFPIPENIREIITFIWGTLVSFSIYLYSFSGYAHDSAKKPIDENQRSFEVA